MSSQIVDQVQKLTKATTDKLAEVEKKNADLQKKLDDQGMVIKKIQETPIQSGAGKLFGEARDTKAEGQWGFKSFAHYLHEIKEASGPGNAQFASDFVGRITKAYDASPGKRAWQETKAVSGMSEAVDSEGGFLVPPTFSSQIFQRVYDNDLLTRTDKYTVTGREMIFPAIDETSRVDGSRFGGVLAYWRDEAATVTATKPKLRQVKLSLNSLMALGYITEELQSDGPALDTFLTKNFAMEIEFAIGNALINGTGVGRPLGIKNAACLVSVSKETGQAAATINTQNLVKMWSRMWGPSRKNAVWLINQDVEPALLTLTLGIGTAGVATYMPPGGLSDSPYATLLGRPVLPVEFCATLGTVGDIILADMSQYVTISKGSADTQMSMHLRFDFAENAYRTIFRIDGRPWWHSALTPASGSSNTLSPFVALATRA